MSARRLLVTGGAGFIGANFVHYWLRTHPADRLVVLDALTYAGNAASLHAAHVHPEFRFVHGDVRDFDVLRSLLADERIDTIIHFAAESHVDRSISAPDMFLETNVLGTHALLKAARERHAAIPPAQRDHFRFHHVSTDEVFGSLADGDAAFTERTAYAPNSPYAASKAASDHLVRAYHRTYGLPVTTSNCSNNYGAFQFPEKLIPLMLSQLLDGKPLPLYGDGLNRRDWLHVTDHCRGIDAVLARGRAGECYNIGGGEERSNLELVSELCARVDARFAADQTLATRFPRALAAHGARSISSLTFVSDRPGHDHRYAIDGSRATAELDFAAAHTLAAGLEETIDWYLANESWWRPLLQRA